MKIQRTVAVAFMVAIGFAKAGEWDDDKLLERLKQAPSKVAEGEAPEGQEDFLKQLREAKGEITLETDATSKEQEKPKAPAKKDKPAKTEKPKTEKSAATVAPTKKPAAAKPKPVAPAKKAAERDELGCLKGTISAKVNAKVNGEWRSEAEIAKAAGVTLDQARGRLYYAAEKGVFERERAIRYRMVPKTSKVLAKTADGE